MRLLSQGGQQPLGLRNMQLVAKFDVEQQAQVEIMFNQWLQNGEQAAGYKGLQRLHGATKISTRFTELDPDRRSPIV